MPSKSREGATRQGKLHVDSEPLTIRVRKSAPTKGLWGDLISGDVDGAAHSSHGVGVTISISLKIAEAILQPYLPMPEAIFYTPTCG